MMWHGILGIIVIIIIAFICSSDKKHVKWKAICWGVLTQFLIAIIIFKIPIVNQFFVSLTALINMLERATQAGTSFVLGYVGGGELPFAVDGPGTSFVLGFQALPLALVVSALSSLLFYWRILPVIIKAFGFVFQKTLNIGGALSLGSAANIFFGIDSAPLIIRNHLHYMSKSELFAFLTTSMATVAGTVMVLYAKILDGVVQDVVGHIIAASVINIPAAITIARIIYPDTTGPTEGDYDKSLMPKSSMDAITRGTTEGLHLVLCIAAMLIVLLALVSLANQLLELLPFAKAVTLQSMLGVVMMPLMWLIGIPFEQAQVAGALMGTKIVLNELVAYIDLAALPAGTLDERSRMIMIYALCGFANFGSVGISIASLNALIPSRRDEIVDLALKSILSGVLATMMTGAIVGLIFTSDTASLILK